MAMKVEIISKERIKPSRSASPDHLQDFKMSLLDELAPPSYVPILLFYSSPDSDSDSVSDKLKKSLSETLARFYPLSGELKRNILVDCNDKGALFVVAKVDVAASKIINYPETDLLHQLFPFDPYKATSETEAMITGVQVNVFACGSVGIGICISHKIADGSTMSSFLNAWAAASTGVDRTLAPRLDSASFFPPKGIDLIKQSDMIRNEKVVTRVFNFDGKNLANLKAKIENGNPTRVEALTALIWKSAIEAVRVNSGKDMIPCSIVTHQVNIRQRMNPPLPENSLGNLCRLAVAPYLNANKEMELQELVNVLRKSIRKINSDYLNKLQGADAMAKAIEPLKELRQLASGGEEVEVFTFSSWTRFPLYEIDFGWGKPIRVCTITVPVRNCVILMATRCGDGIEAWVTLTERDMAEFERSDELLQFVSASS